MAFLKKGKLLTLKSGTNYYRYFFLKPRCITGDPDGKTGYDYISPDSTEKVYESITTESNWCDSLNNDSVIQCTLVSVKGKLIVL